MEWLKEMIRKKPVLALGVPAGLGSGDFITNFIIALSDGKINSTELHALLSTSGGVQTFVLFYIMFALFGEKK